MMKANNLLKEYFTHSQVHGLRYVADSRRHWLERLFWFLSICISWYGCYLLLSSSWDSYVNNSLSFGTETTYTTWNTSSFAVTVCESDNFDYIDVKAEELYGDHDWNFNEIIKELTFFKGNMYTASEYCSAGELECPLNGYKEFVMKFRSKCEEIFKSCKWLSNEMNCCKSFHLLETELGPCFSLNSIQVKDPLPIPLISNQITGPGVLTLELFVPANVYLHSPADVPSLNTLAEEVVEARKGIHTLLEYGVTEILNEAEVQRVDIARRRCRFPEENDLSVYDRYSYSACITECRAKQQMKLCNCSSHFTPKIRNENVCGLSGLLCLDRYFQQLTVLINSWSTNSGLICSCLPGCSETEFDLVKTTNTEIRANHSVVELAMSRLPSVRLKRSVVRSTLDLVVSMGGIVGLFVGASLLSFVEVLYFFTFRFCGTVRTKRGKITGRSIAIGRN